MCNEREKFIQFFTSDIPIWYGMNALNSPRSKLNIVETDIKDLWNEYNIGIYIYFSHLRPRCHCCQTARWYWCQIGATVPVLNPMAVPISVNHFRHLHRLHFLCRPVQSSHSEVPGYLSSNKKRKRDYGELAR